MNEIHPLFKYIDDKAAASACSELLIPRLFKFKTSPELQNRYRSDVFPPTPSYITSIIATYIKENSDNELTTQTRLFDTGSGEHHISTKQLTSMYRETIGSEQEAMPLLHGMTHGTLATGDYAHDESTLQTWYVNLVDGQRNMEQPRGGKLLAAYITHQALIDGYDFDTIATPTCVMNELPLLARESTLKISNQLQNQPYIPEELMDIFNQLSKPVLQNDPVVMGLGEIASSSFLPTPDELEARLVIILPANSRRIRS